MVKCFKEYSKQALGYLIFLMFVGAFAWDIIYSNTHTFVSKETREMAKEFAEKNKISIISRDLTENTVFYKGEFCYGNILSVIEFKVDTDGNFEVESIKPKIVKINKVESDAESVLLLASYSHDEYKGKIIKCNNGVNKLWTPIKF